MPWPRSKTGGMGRVNAGRPSDLRESECAPIGHGAGARPSHSNKVGDGERYLRREERRNLGVCAKRLMLDVFHPARRAEHVQRRALDSAAVRAVHMRRSRRRRHHHSPVPEFVATLLGEESGVAHAIEFRDREQPLARPALYVETMWEQGARVVSHGARLPQPTTPREARG